MASLRCVIERYGRWRLIAFFRLFGVIAFQRIFDMRFDWNTHTHTRTHTPPHEMVNNQMRHLKN